MDWPHAPLHRFVDGDAIYFVTAATYLKKHIYRTAARLDGLQSRLFDLARTHECSLQAWSIFTNHYHLVVSADGEKLRGMLTRLHTLEGIDSNEIDGTPGRQVWYQFRETELTYERSWLARLRYTHQNPVHHRVVPDANLYRWCSASWFERTARPAFVNVVRSFPIDRVNVADDFEVDSPK
jgi:putative transposase